MSAACGEPAPVEKSARLVLFLTVFIDLLGFGIVIPFLPLFAERNGIGAAGVGAILAAYSAMQFICAPLLGRLSDRLGRRPIIMLGLAGSAGGYLIYGCAASFATLLLSRVVHGACAATISTAQAYIADTTAESDRAGGMGLIGAAFGLGFVLGPALGGLLGRHGLRAPAFFACCLSLADLMLAAFLLPEPRRSKTGIRRAGVLSALALWRPDNRVTGNLLTQLLAMAFLFTFGFAVLETTFAMMAPQVYGYGPLGVGGLLAFAGLIQAIVQGSLLARLVSRVGEARLVMVGAAAMAIGMAPLASLSSSASLLTLLAVLSAGYGLTSPSIASMISKQARSGNEGELLGINQSALSMARIAGPIAGGMVYGSYGPAAPYLGGAAMMAAAFIMAWRVAAAQT